MFASGYSVRRARSVGGSLRTRGGQRTVAALAAAMIAAGCGGGGTSSRSTAKVLTAAEVTAALLTPADMPTGWAALSATTADAAPGAGGLLCSGRQIGLLEAANATARFTEPGGTSQITEVLESLPKKQATEEYSVARDLVRSCVGRSWTVTTAQGTKTSLSLGSATISSGRSRDFSAVLTVTSGPGPLTTDVTFFRDGTVFGVVASANTAAAANAGVSDPFDLPLIVKAAKRKVADAVKGRHFRPPRPKHSRAGSATAP